MCFSLTVIDWNDWNTCWFLALPIYTISIVHFAIFHLFNDYSFYFQLIQFQIHSIQAASVEQLILIASQVRLRDCLIWSCTCIWVCRKSGWSSNRLIVQWAYLMTASLTSLCNFKVIGCWTDVWCLRLIRMHNKIQQSLMDTTYSVIIEHLQVIHSLSFWFSLVTWNIIEKNEWFDTISSDWIWLSCFVVTWKLFYQTD